MQLATSQRAHPPPVPPRPSRQVVAEALKRTARPPCPTRQAPPPPNTRPWRLDDRESSAGPPSGPRLGRTVVYESAGVPQQQQQQQQNGHQNRSASEPRECRAPHESQRPLASSRSSGDETSADRAATANGGNNNSAGNTANAIAEKTEARGSSSGVGGSTRATSERSEAENQRERPNSLLLLQQQQQPQQQQQQSRRSGGGSDQRCDRENSATQLSATDVEIAGRTVGLCYKSDENAAAGREEAVDQPARRRDDGICEKEKTRNFDGTASRNSPEFSKITEQQQQQQQQEDEKPATGSTSLTASENIGRSVEAIERRRDDNNGNNGNVDDPRVERRSRSFGDKKADLPGEAAIGTKSTSSAVATPTKIAASAGVVNNETAAKVVEPISLPVENDDVVVSGAAAAATAAAAAVVASGVSSSAATAVSSDDCATVVIVDEPERKIAFTEDYDNNIHHQDWLEAGIRYSSTKITLPGDDPVDRADEFADYDEERRGNVRYDYSSICERIAMSSLQGLPPLPRSLSGFNLSEGRREATEPPPPPTRSSSKTQKNVKSTQPSSSRPSPPGRQLTTLDTQLAILRKEMFGLRQLDLSLLSQLWSLNESIQEFRQLLQEQEDRAPSPSPSSEEGDDNSYGGHPPPPPRRPAPLLHHHRPPRPPRPLRPPASDDSPSSEEYGAV